MKLLNIKETPYFLMNSDQLAFLKSNYQNFDKFLKYQSSRNKKSYKKGLEYIESLKNECFFCSKTENLDFLHKNQLEKRYAVNQMSKMSPKTIKNEIDKCWCVCKSCKKKISTRLMDPLPEFWA